MASDGPFRWRPRQVARLLGRSAVEWGQDQAPRHAAALSYYTLFAIGPVLLIVASIAGLAFGQADVRAAITGQFGRLLGDDAAKALDDLMGSDLRHKAGWGLALGLAFLLVGAASVFSQLRTSLNAIWELETKPAQGVVGKAKQAVTKNLLGVAAVMGVGFLLLVSLAVSAALQVLTTRADEFLPMPAAFAWLLHAALSLLVTAVLFALLFRFLPDARVAWRDVAFGACVTAILFLAGEYAIGAYLGQTATASQYGAAGAVVVLLLWVYYSGLIFLYGAELTQVYANLHGGHVRPKPGAEPIQRAVARKHDLPSREGTRGPSAAPER